METYQCGNDIRLSPSAAEVLDEGEGLGNLGHNGAEEPVVVGADIGHGLKICFIFRNLRFSNLALRGSILTIFSCILMLGFEASSQSLTSMHHVELRFALLPAAAAGFAPQLVFVVSTKPHR